jgi:hypothetical protein
MLSDDVVSTLDRHARACDAARDALVSALRNAESLDRRAPEDEQRPLLEPVAEALSDWRDAQQAFMDTVEQSGAPNVEMAALLLKSNHGVETDNARRGLPGASVDGANQPFNVDTTGMRGEVLTRALDHLSDD